MYVDFGARLHTQIADRKQLSRTFTYLYCEP